MYVDVYARHPPFNVWCCVLYILYTNPASHERSLASCSRRRSLTARFAALRREQNVLCQSAHRVQAAAPAAAACAPHCERHSLQRQLKPVLRNREDVARRQEGESAGLARSRSALACACRSRSARCGGTDHAEESAVSTRASQCDEVHPRASTFAARGPRQQGMGN